MTIIKELQEHASNNNIYYIEELADIIIEENIQSLAELEEYEKRYHMENGKYLSIEEVVKKCVENIDIYPFEYDGLLYNQIQELKNERKLIEDEILENKILHIIKYYYLTKRDNPFPYYTFLLIIKDKL